MKDHILRERVITSIAIHLHALDLITAAATDAMSKANTLSEVLRVAAMDAVMLFSSLVLFPHEKGACNSQVRAEVKRRLTLWGAGDLESLAELARASKPLRAFKSGSTASPTLTLLVRALIHKGQFSRAGMLADSFDVAPVSA